MNIHFHKMHGLGNDFVIIDARHDALSCENIPNIVRKLACRQTGIGCDQLIILHLSDTCDAFMQIFNADGGVVDACGNATRCVGWIIMQETGMDHVKIETTVGVLHATAKGTFRVQVDMGLPRCDWESIPLSAPMDTLRIPFASLGVDEYGILCETFTCLDVRNGTAVSMGNPHWVMFVDDVAAFPLSDVGEALEHAPLFPMRANITVAHVHARDHIVMRTWERGVGMTLACGTAACATMVAARRRKLVDAFAILSLVGGDLSMVWQGSEHDMVHSVMMTGDVAYVFHGVVSHSFLL